VPRGRNADDRLTNLEQRLEVLEAREASLLERPEYTDEEIVEIGLILLAYIYEGDTERYAEFLALELGMPADEAEEVAPIFGRALEERRKTAENPEYPV
jgi:hypothetical protein